MIHTDDEMYLLDAVQRDRYSETDRAYALFKGREKGIGVWKTNGSGGVYKMIAIISTDEVVKRALSAPEHNEAVIPNYEGKPGLTDSDAQVLFDAGIEMTMPGGNKDFYLFADRATIEMLVGRLADSALHPEQKKEGATRVMRHHYEIAE